MDTPPTPDDVDKIGQLWQWAMGGVGAGAAYLWHSTFGRIKALEDGKADKDDLSTYIKGAEQSRQETRDSLIKLFDRVDKTSQTLARIEGKLDR